jgi:hypothetical protein
MEFLNMRNVKCRQWWAILLAGLLSLITCLWGSKLLVTMVPTAPIALAAAHHASNDNGSCMKRHQGPSLGSVVVVAQNDVECGSITAFGGTVAINGEVRGDVVTFNSDVVIAGTVDGNVEQFGGKLVLRSGSFVHGNVDLYGAAWAEGTNAGVGGTFSDHTSAINWLLPYGDAWDYIFWSLLLWIGLGLLLTWLLPEHVMIVRTTAVYTMKRCLMLGLLSILLAPAVLLVLFALVLSIPLAILVALGLLAAWVLGTTAIGCWLGEYLVNRFMPQYNSRIMHIVVGITVLVLAGSLPYIGWLIIIGSGMWGLGAVFLSRFGTRLYSKPKQPLPL